MAKSVFEQIKKQNGERFAKAIRGYDNGIFDIPGIVDIVKYAGSEAEPIMEYLESLKRIQIEETGVYQDPITLLDKAGYNAYYVTNLEEQNRIQKYYADGEKLCTFRDSTRFERYHIINAVRKDVDKIRRKDFRGKEEREDEYGTSVISIQILKIGGFISIKNRYNHTVQNPDNTLNSNPDNIIPGLSNALRHHFGTDFSSQKAQLPGGYTILNGQILKYNYEQDNIYFGSDFYVQDGQVHRLESHELMLDSYIFDMRTKTLKYPISEEDGDVDEAFKKVFLKEIEGHKVILKKDKDGQHLFIRKEGEKDPTKDTEILTVKDGVITSLNLPTTTKIGNFFLFYNIGIKKINLPNVKSVGEDFLRMNATLEEIGAPMLEEDSGAFLYGNKNLKKFSLPHFKKAGSGFLYSNADLEEFNAPLLEQAGSSFLYHNKGLTTFSAPKLKKVGNGFLMENQRLCTFNAPQLQKVLGYFLYGNKNLKKFSLPHFKKAESGFLHSNTDLEEFNAPLLEQAGSSFLYHNKGLTTFSAPKLKKVGNGFLMENQRLCTFNAPQLQKVLGYFLYNNRKLTVLNLPNLEIIGECFMTYNQSLKTFYAPKLPDETPHIPFYRNPNCKTLWENHRQLVLPEKESIKEKEEKPKNIGISDVLRTAEAEKQEPEPTPEPEPQKGISARLMQIEKEKTDNPSFFKRLRDWLLPQK